MKKLPGRPRLIGGPKPKHNYTVLFDGHTYRLRRGKDFDNADQAVSRIYKAFARCKDRGQTEFDCVSIERVSDDMLNVWAWRKGPE